MTAPPAPRTPRAAPRSCVACNAAIRRLSGLPICSRCSALAYREFKRQHHGQHPDEWVRAWNLTFRDPGAVASLIAVARSAQAVAGG